MSGGSYSLRNITSEDITLEDGGLNSLSLRVSEGEASSLLGLSRSMGVEQDTVNLITSHHST